MNSATALQQTNEIAIANHAITALPSNTQVVRPVLTAEQISKLDTCLALYSESKFIENSWTISIDVSNQNENLRFPEDLAQTDLQILKGTVLQNLLEFGSCSHVKRLIADARIVYGFLQEKRLYIENSRTATVDLLISYLEGLAKNDGQKNSIIRTYERLFTFCAEYGFAEVGRVIDFSHRFCENRVAKRAPDKVVTDAITRLIFDLNYPMPCAIRCVLMILRLIPKRISEVLSMDVDCLVYPAEGVYSIRIATSKETVRHIPIVKTYHFHMEGLVEQFFYTVIKAQQQNVSNQQTSPIDQDYLFYSAEHKRVLTTADVNAYLAKLITDNNICNSNGTPAKMTSHDFRHITIGERLRGNIISAELTSVEANHSSVDQTITYGYQSVHDEAEHLRAITDQVFDRTKSSANEAGTPQELAPKKYDRLEAQPYTRIIPCYGLCANTNCKPQFEQCVYCGKYSPNAEYLEYFEAAKNLVEDKINTLKMKNGDPKALDFNSRRLQAILRWIELIQNKSSQNQKEAQAV